MPRPEDETLAEGQMSAGAAFEETMVGLERARDTVEADFRKRLDELDQCARRLATATADLEARARANQEQRDALVRRARERLLTAGTAEAGAGAETDGWPTGGNPLRRALNSVMTRLLRDHLETIDRRSTEIRSRLEVLEGLFGDLLDISSAPAEGEVAGSGEQPPGDPAGLQGAVRSAFECASEALTAAAGVHERTVNLINAKDAEMLQRAAEGPLARMELVFGEFARQQEALLSQLVGKRQELDELIEKATAASSGRDPEASAG